MMDSANPDLVEKTRLKIMGKPDKKLFDEGISVEISIRTANAGDDVRVRDFYDSMIDAMEDAEYKPGWKREIYPTREFLIRSIAQGELYMGETEGGIASCMVVNHEYNDGYNGIH